MVTVDVGDSLEAPPEAQDGEVPPEFYASLATVDTFHSCALHDALSLFQFFSKNY